MKYVRPLTGTMIRQMLLVRSLELSENVDDIGLMHHFRGSLPGLYWRGFINSREVTLKGKEIMSFYLTNSGIDFLNDFVERFTGEN